MEAIDTSKLDELEAKTGLSLRRKSAEQPAAEPAVQPAADAESATYAVAPDDPPAATAVLDPDSDEALYGDDGFEDDEPAAPAAAPPSLPTTWSAYSATGGDAAKVHLASGWARVEIGFQRHGATYGQFDTSHREMRERALAAARNLAAVQRWFGAVLEKAKHDRAARVARAEAAACAARREVFVAGGGGPDLAQRLRDLDGQVRDLQARAAEAEELARYAAEAVAARRKEATAAIAGSSFDSALGASIVARKREEEALAKIVAAVQPLLDELLAARLTRDTLGAVVSHDKTTLVRQLVGTLEDEAARAAMRPEPQPAA